MPKTMEEIFAIIQSNDTAEVAKMLQASGLRSDSIPPIPILDNCAAASTTLVAASAAACFDKLNDDLAREIIQHTAVMVDIFGFLRFVIAASRIKANDFNTIPEDIRISLQKNDYADLIGCAIMKLDNDTLKTLLNYILSDEVDKIDRRFNLPILRCIYCDGIIPTNLMFCLMAGNVMPPLPMLQLF